MDNLLTLQEAADLLQKSTQTLRRMIKRGELQAKRIRTAQGFQYGIEGRHLSRPAPRQKPIHSEQLPGQEGDELTSPLSSSPPLPSPLLREGPELHFPAHTMDSLLNDDFYILQLEKVDVGALEQQLQKERREKMVLIHILESLQGELAQEKRRPWSFLMNFLRKF